MIKDGSYRKNLISIKVEGDYKTQIETISKELDMNTSEFIRKAIDNEISTTLIGKNQSYLYQVLESILSNILDQKMYAINQMLKTIYIKQELIIELFKWSNNEIYTDMSLEDFIKEFMTSYNSELQELTTL